MSCPFRHLWPSVTAPPPGHGGEAAAALPAAAAVEARALPAPAAAGQQQHGQPDLGPATPATSAAAAEQCPFLAGVGGVALEPASGAAGSSAAASAGDAEQQSEQEQQPQQQQPQPQPAVCPLGFGAGGKRPQLSEYQCPLCRSMLFECVATACGHRFCAGCIRDAADCPLCGADAAPLTPDAEAQAHVDRYIEAHAGSHTMWELEGSGGVEGVAGERGRASFLLQLGLRAIAAGNSASARCRFKMCQVELEQQLEAARAAGGGGGAPMGPLLCRLGAVSGCLGDCCRAEGDADGTLQHYERSVELLQGAGADPEAQQALSVALGKVGELRHLLGDLPAAAALYGRALSLRRSLLAATHAQWPATTEVGQAQQTANGSGATATDAAAAGAGSEGAEARCSAALDLAASCLKLAGAQRGLGAEEEAEALLEEAAQLLDGQATGLSHQPPRLQRKHAALAHFAAALRQPASGAEQQ